MHSALLFPYLETPPRSDRGGRLGGRFGALAVFHRSIRGASLFTADRRDLLRR